MAAPARLHVLMDGEHAGLLERQRGRLVVTYDDDYRSNPSATPISTAMPLALQVHAGEPVVAFIDGLLPDSEPVRQRWAAEFQTSDTPFDLIAAVGEDCAGAVQFVRDERLGQLDPGGIVWLEEHEIGAWIRQIRQDPAGWLHDVEFGQFSLAGAQSKFALVREGDTWGRPHGAVPTSHIVKPGSTRFADHEVNEHLALGLAAAVGLPTARSEVIDFDGERAVVVERFDRLIIDGRLRRVHQEDMCQALGLRPAVKYQNRGGPSAVSIAALLRERSSSPTEDVQAFVDAFVFNWLLANTDAHAKNFGILLAGEQCRLAPLYDLASALPYTAASPVRRPRTELDGSRLALAMSVGGSYRFSEIRRRDFEELFGAMGLDVARQLDRTDELLLMVRDAIPVVVAPAVEALGGTMPSRFETSIMARLGLCRDVLANRPATGRRR